MAKQKAPKEEFGNVNKKAAKEAKEAAAYSHFNHVLNNDREDKGGYKGPDSKHF